MVSWLMTRTMKRTVSWWVRLRHQLNSDGKPVKVDDQDNEQDIKLVGKTQTQSAAKLRW